jgi:hypothetical protein
MFKIGRKILLTFTFTFIMFISMMFNQTSFASSTNPFTVQDAPIPGWNLTPTNDPQFNIAYSYGGGWQMTTNLASDVMEGTLHLRIFVDYTISCMDTVSGAKSLFDAQTPLQGLSDAAFQQILNDPSITIIEHDLQNKSRTLVYKTSPQGTLHPQCYARVIYQDETNPNWLYWIDMNGNGFSSGSDLQDRLTSVMLHCGTLIQNKTRTNATPTPIPTITPDNNSQTQESFIIQNCEGNVMVQRGGIGAWIPATKGMLVFPLDAIKTSGSPRESWVNIVFGNENASALGQDVNDYIVKLGEGTIVLLSSEKVSNMVSVSRLHVPKPTSPEAQTLIYIGDSQPQHIPFRIETPDALISDSQTEFEIIVNSSGTSVFTIDGAVQVSDLNEFYTVQVDAGKTITLQNGESPGALTSFNVNSLNNWWTTAPVATNEPTNSPSTLGITNSTSTSLPILPFLGVITAIILALIVVVVVLSKKRKKTITQEEYLPPPPPPDN